MKSGLSIFKDLVCVPVLLLLSCGPRTDGDVSRIAFLRGPSAVQAVRLIDSLTGEGNWCAGIYDEPVRLRAAMIGGEVDFAVLPMTMAALLKNKGVDYRVAAVPIWGSLYLCGTDSTVCGLPDLRGRKVNMMGRGMTPDILFRHLLLNCGLVPGTDVEIDYRFPDHIALANAAIAGRVGFFVLSEPYVSQVVKANPEVHVLADLSEEWCSATGIPLPETAFLCRGDLSDADVTARVVSALESSSEWVTAHPDSAAALAVSLGINPDSAAVSLSIPRSRFRVVRAGDARDEINCYLRMFLDSSPEAIGNGMPDETFIAR